ncbi:MAG TPA: endonuclease/exonuclease/phosphatase family protein [Thermoanaerobaculia bacterium]
MSKRRVLAVAALLFAAFATYRVFGVYTVRSGECAPGDSIPMDHRFPKRGAGAEQARTLVVMSYNVEGHAALLRKDHLRKIAAVIVAAKADLVGLQEVHRGTWQSRFRDQAAELARLSGMTVYFGRSFDALGGEFGNAILTRGTLIEAEVYELPSVGEPRTLLRGTVEIGGHILNFYVTHLATWGRFNRASRTEQIECIAQHIRRSPYPFVVVGDFNASPVTPEVSSFTTSNLVRLANANTGGTHRLTGQHLDYIFSDPGWDVKSARVLAEGPSDHWPLLAELDWIASARQRAEAR